MFSKKWPIFSEDEIQAVAEVMRSGKVNYWTGSQCKLFEKEYAEYLGVKHAISVCNGTSALELCLHALGIGPGDEVIVPCRTFMASASCVVEVGARPVVCDVDLHTQNICVETIKPHVTAKTKAIIVVHLGGLPCDMPAIIAFAKAHNLYVIEDCAQAHGALINDQPVGSFADMAAFSFCQDKIISTLGEGGLVVTDNEVLWKKAWAYKDHGKGYDTVYHKQHPAGFRWLHDSFGSNYRMTEAQAVVGRIHLQKLGGWQKIRQRNAEILDLVLRDFKDIRLIEVPAGMIHAYYRYYFFVPAAWRDALTAAMTQQGIWCQVGTCSEIYLEQAFMNANLAPKSRLPNAQTLSETSVALLIDPIYSEAEIKQLAQILKQKIGELHA
jgi:dTDP-4-amino-4,6-dideoxygalactose transaminase